MALREVKMKGGRKGSLALAVVLGSAIGAFAAPPKITNLKKVLVLDKSQGGAGGHLESRRDLNAALNALGADKGFTVTIIGQNDGASKISTEFSAASLATYQVVMFSNNDGVDAQLDAASKTNLETYVKNGGGFIPVHAASAFISNWPWLTSVLVQSFYGPHGNNKPQANLTHDPDALKDASETKGIFKGLTAPLAFLDEYYSFQKSPRATSGVTVLVTVDEKSFSQPVNGPMGTDHPVIWAKTEGKGRVIHMSMGHSWSTNNVYTAKSNYLTELLYGQLRYAAGDFIGCTDTKYKEYNPDATKSDQTACKNLEPSTITINQAQDRLPLISQGTRSISVGFYKNGAHEVSVLDMSGKVVDHRIGAGPAQYDLPTPAKAGMYLVKAKANGQTQVHRITVL
jgi:type 1 glutamine amidotransferase